MINRPDLASAVRPVRATLPGRAVRGGRAPAGIQWNDFASVATVVVVTDRTGAASPGEAFSFLVTFAAPAAGFETALSGLHASLELSDAAP
ncbi:hypothetical protein JQS43_23550 [Natronosporangium hydrolyticum]|uniref:Uncharacterized protein n=1 Tax=Natronosporangium hydrolyticum TaxID=2811111 RepID=A0A895YG25_9ACTN|nr:hypothetical protein [Natronosporangium hydrolyticum]QSB14429.1 hypothetical protein JQS43_23550 [Natronosporangium hydrolyticum]